MWDYPTLLISYINFLTLMKQIWPDISNDVKIVLITIKLISWTFFTFYFCSSRVLLLVRGILMDHIFSSYIGRRNQKNIVKWVYFITTRKKQWFSFSEDYFKKWFWYTVRNKLMSKNHTLTVRMNSFYQLQKKEMILIFSKLLYSSDCNSFDHL